MKVICVNDIYDQPVSYGAHNLDLTIGKIYDVVIGAYPDDGICKIQDEWLYKITNDKGYTCHYSYGRFVIPLNEYRQKQLQILHEEV
jgi:hypothetical protein